MTLQGFHLPLVARALLLSLLMLLGLSSHAQTVAESMALFDDGKTKEAVAQLTKLAQDGDPEAQNLLGVLYDNGQGVAQDYQSARAWFEKAAARGHASAQFRLKNQRIAHVHFDELQNVFGHLHARAVVAKSGFHHMPQE
jgi:TPR repeat protein